MLILLKLQVNRSYRQEQSFISHFFERKKINIYATFIVIKYFYLVLLGQTYFWWHESLKIQNLYSHSTSLFQMIPKMKLENM